MRSGSAACPLTGRGTRALAAGDLAGRERDFDADDRLDAGIGAGSREFERAEQIAGIGDRHRRHRLGAAQLDQLLDLDRAGRQRIGAVGAQMNEIGERHAGMMARTGRESSRAITGLGNLGAICRTRGSTTDRGLRSSAAPRSVLCRPEPAVLQRHDAVEAVGEVEIVRRDQRGEAGVAHDLDQCRR